VFYFDGKIYRYVEKSKLLFLTEFLSSNLYQELLDKEMIVNTKITALEENPQLREHFSDSIDQVFQHEKIEFITYPYEWPISMHKDAAILTLKIQTELLKCGFSLKDATPYNIQFKNSNPIFIDISSIEKVEQTGVWKPYNQFCQFWLYPMLLYRRGFHDFQLIYLKYMDGIPLEKVVSILNIWKPSLRFGLVLDYLLPALMSKSKYFRKKSGAVQLKNRRNSEKIISMTINRLKRKTAKLGKNKFKGHWINYSETHSYTEENERKKDAFVHKVLTRESSSSHTLLDMGCNTGKYSRLAAMCGYRVVATDSDIDCIERLYIDARDNQLAILPLCIDLFNPSPAIGWNNIERQSFLNRVESKFDFVLGLALVHHLLVVGRVPLASIVELQKKLTKRFLITEFIGTNDKMFKTLMQHRSESYDYYNINYFKSVYSESFEIISEERIIEERSEMERALFLMEIKNN
jgi:2-polyprenyl-3-methyl-5-hydroxy-6-metoxy-1,4-benzoquinol methylase